MSAENKNVVRRFIEQVWNARRPDLLEQLMAEDVILNEPGMTDRDSLKQFVVTTVAAMPDFEITINDEIAEGDRVVIRETFSGTLQGELAGMPATGKHAVWSGIVIFRLANGKIVEQWPLLDLTSMMQQFGLMPPPGESGG
jgi:steroid delta-isomerase-like uncharacterized protein